VAKGSRCTVPRRTGRCPATQAGSHPTTSTQPGATMG
jgi:hypothetical protein